MPNLCRYLMIESLDIDPLAAHHIQPSIKTLPAIFLKNRFMNHAPRLQVLSPNWIETYSEAQLKFKYGRPN